MAENLERTYQRMMVDMDQSMADIEALTVFVRGALPKKWNATCSIWLDREARANKGFQKAWIVRHSAPERFKKERERLRDKFAKAARVLKRPMEKA